MAMAMGTNLANLVTEIAINITNISFVLLTGRRSDKARVLCNDVNMDLSDKEKQGCSWETYITHKLRYLGRKFYGL
jgi:hypothetical protein